MYNIYYTGNIYIYPKKIVFKNLTKYDLSFND